MFHEVIAQKKGKKQTAFIHRPVCCTAGKKGRVGTWLTHALVKFAKRLEYLKSESL